MLASKCLSYSLCWRRDGKPRRVFTTPCCSATERQVLAGGVIIRERGKAHLNARVKGLQSTSTAISRAEADSIHRVLLTGLLKQEHEEIFRSPSHFTMNCIL